MVNHTVKDYAAELRECFDYQAYANLMCGIGQQCNEPKLRFDKSDFVEKSLEELSDGRLKWVDEEGYDNIDVKYGYKLEVKFVEHSLFTEKKVVLKESTKEYIIKNNQGNSYGSKVQTPADYYLFFQQNAMGVLAGSHINKYTSATDATINAKMPLSALSLVFSPNEIKIKDYSFINYKKEKDDMQRNIIRSYRI